LATITDLKVFIDKIDKELAVAKEKNKPGIYMINCRVLDTVANEAKRYYDKLGVVITDFHRCSNCHNNWDVIITFK
jgi:hypothetical protein